MADAQPAPKSNGSDPFAAFGQQLISDYNAAKKSSAENLATGKKTLETAQANLENEYEKIGDLGANQEQQYNAAMQHYNDMMQRQRFLTIDHGMTMKGFMPIAAAFGILASALTGKNLASGLAVMASGLSGFANGKTEQYNAAYKQWSDATQGALDEVKEITDHTKDIMANQKLSLDARLKQVDLATTEFRFLNQASGDPSKLATAIATMGNAHARMLSAFKKTSAKVNPNPNPTMTRTALEAVNDINGAGPQPPLDKNGKPLSAALQGVSPDYADYKLKAAQWKTENQHTAQQIAQAAQSWLVDHPGESDKAAIDAVKGTFLNKGILHSKSASEYWGNQKPAASAAKGGAVQIGKYSYTDAEIDAAATKYGISRDQVIAKLKAKLGELMAQGPAIDSLLGPPAATTAAPPIDSVLGASTPATPVAARPATPDANTLKKAFGDTPLGETFAELGRERNQLGSELKADITPDKGADTDPLHNLIYGPAGALRAVAEGTAGFVAGKATRLYTEAEKALGGKVDPDKAEQSVEDYFYYRPKTILGQELSNFAAFPLTGAQQFGDVISEEVYEANPDKPALAAIADVIPDLLVMATPFKDVGKSIALKTTERAGPLVKTSIDGMNAENARAVPELKKLPAPKGDIDEALAGEKVVERRSNTVKRTKIDELLAQGKHAEVKEMLYRNDMTGLPNGLAFKDDYISAPSPYIAFMDTDSLKFRNDTYGEAAGDEMIRRVGKTLKAQGLDAYRLNNTGDEFLIKGQTPAEINANLHKVADALELQKFPDGTAPRITWGISETGAGNTYTVAEANMRAQKVIREANGQRAARGATPPDFKGTDFQDLQDQQDLAVTDVKDPEAPKAGQVYRGPEATSTELQRKRITKQDEDIGTRAAAGAPPPEEPPEGGGTPEDWQARAKQVAEGRKKANSFKAKVAEAQKFIHHYFPDKTGIGEEASYTLAQVVVRHAQMRAAFMHASELRRAIIARLSDADQLKFIHEMQTGVKGGMLPEVKKAIREITEDLFRRETSVMVDVKHRADHFPQYFLHPEQVSAWWESQRAERLKTGKASFQFERHWNDIAEAIDKGGAVPISNNAEDLLRMRYMASNRLVARAEMLAAVKDHGLIRPGDEALPGEKVVEGPDGVKYVGDESVMQMIENGFFSNSLWNEKTVSGVAFRTAMGAKMIVMPLELGLSAFHPIHLLLGVKPMHALAEGYHLFRDQPVTPESLTALAKVLEKSIMNVGDMRFHPIKATLNMLQGVEQNYASRPYKIIRDAWLGKIDPKDVPPEVARDIQHMLAGGFRPVPTAEYIGAAKEKAMDAWSDKNLGQLAKHIIPYVLRQLMTPVMDWYVPYLKTQAFIDGKNRIIDAHPELESPGLPQTLAFSRLRRNIDLRFSELPYDIQFWSKAATGTMQAGFLSFTWLYGYVHQFPMALTDVPRLVSKGMSKEKGKTYISSRMSYALLYSAYSFMLGGLITYALTGNRPKQVKDFLYPVRHVDPDGTEHRISLPFFDRYPYDAYALYHAQGAAGLARMGAYRLDPVISMLSEQVTNKNFYDQELSDPTAPWLDRMGQRAKGQFISMTPISVAGLVTHADTLAQESKGQQAVAAGLAFLGGNPAPSYISKTTLENKLAYLYNHYHQDTTAYGKLPEIEAHRNLRELYKAGKMDEFQAAFEDAAQKFQWSKQSNEDFVRSLAQPAGVFEFEGLPPAVQVDLLENEMTPAEAAEYLPFASLKAKLAYTAAPNQ